MYNTISPGCIPICQAGEDLEEDEDEGAEDDEEATADILSTTLTAGLSDIAETTPLLTSSLVSVSMSRSRSRHRHNSVGPTGNATVTQAVFLFLVDSHILGPTNIPTAVEVLYWDWRSFGQSVGECLNIDNIFTDSSLGS